MARPTVRLGRLVLAAGACLVVVRGAAPATAGKPGPAAVGAPAPVHAGPERRRPPAFAEVVEKLKVLTDGKGHYVVLQPFGGNSSDHVYYGDGMAFFALRVVGAGSSGDGSGKDDHFDRSFWEPRFTQRWQGTVGYKAGRYFVQCGERATELQLAPEADAKRILETASFEGPLWKYRAYALARDDRGTYYYVDRVREPENSMSFRLWAGPRGAVKPMKMVNVVSDSAGDIFATKGGELRLVLDKKETTWIRGKRRVPLTFLPVGDNHVLIYGDLGAYAGQRLGTPCDDL